MLRIEHVCNSTYGKAFKRIDVALRRHFTDVIWTTRNPDIKIVETLGGGEVEYFKKCKTLDNIIIFQQNYFTSEVKPEVWLDIWKQCKLVLSFHDLQSYFPNDKFSFMRTALGAEPDDLTINLNNRPIKVYTTGYIAETEAIDCLYDACKETKNVLNHTGKDFGWSKEYYKFIPYMEDINFNRFLTNVQYVSGLRLIEGFEMHCIEGAMTGAVPLIPDEPMYDFYKDFGIYINSKENIVSQLVDIFNKDYNPLSLEQINYVRNEFSWSKICRRIQERIEENA